MTDTKVNELLAYPFTLFISGHCNWRQDESGLITIPAAFVFLGPALQVSNRKTIEPVVLVLLDDSLSMSIKDKYVTDSQQTCKEVNKLGWQPMRIESR